MGAEWWEAMEGVESEIMQAVLKSFKNDPGKQLEGFRAEE